MSELPERRLLILAPTGRDAELTRSTLAAAMVPTEVCADLNSLETELARGAAALLIAEESLSTAAIARLASTIARQPAWSDIPVLVVARYGTQSDSVDLAVRQLGNVTLLERPLRIAALVSAASSALRARARQYQVRDQMTREIEQAQVLRLSRESVRTRTEELEALMEIVPAAVWIAHDPQCSRITGNNLGCAVLRMQPRDNLSQSAQAPAAPTHFRIVERGAEQPGSDLPMQRAARGEEVRNAECDIVFDDGTRVVVYGNALPLRGSDGEIRGSIGAFLDITQRREYEQRLSDADRRKDEFLAMLAHELRNPLAPLRSTLEIMQLLPIRDAEVESLRERMQRHVDHMVRLVDDLLEVSRITRGKIELQRQRVDLSSLLANALETSRPLMQARGVAVRVALPGEPVGLDADAVRLTQVFANLLNNAAKYAEGGEVELSARREGEQALVSVRDNGVGIPAEMLGRVFDMFTQVDSTLRGSRDGLGIGLTIVRSLVAMHGGSVEVRSDGVGHGSEFIVRLPVRERSSGADASTDGGASDGARGECTVMVVDDNKDAADSLARVLELMGACVTVAYDAQSALVQLRAHRPALAFLDIGMPAVDGYELARRVRQEFGARDITLIAVTGWGQSSDRERSREAGFDRHLVKPVGIEDLKHAMAAARTGGR